MVERSVGIIMMVVVFVTSAATGTPAIVAEELIRVGNVMLDVKVPKSAAIGEAAEANASLSLIDWSKVSASALLLSR